MFKILKLALVSFKNNWEEYLGISFVFGVITFISFLIARTITGFLIPYVVIMIPAIISLKFFAFKAYDSAKIEYRSLKIGFLTFFKSIRVYLLVILKPILWGLLAFVVCYSIFFRVAINMASQTIPNLMESLVNFDTALYAYEEMFSIENVKQIILIGEIISVSVGFIVYFLLKLRRDFIPFVAFEMPINSKRAVEINRKILKGKYFKFLLANILILLMLVIPGALTYGCMLLLKTNETLSQTTILLVCASVACIFSSPIITFKQLHYIYAYKEYSRPYKEDFDNELKNVLKEIEGLAEKLNKNDEK